MTALELQERKNRALDILQRYDSEEAISLMETLARQLARKEKPAMERPNCFTLEEVKEMLKETQKDAKNKVGISHKEMQQFFNKWR